MGQLGHHPHGGTNIPFFTGDVVSYPIELFIHIVENEASHGNDSDEKTFQVAWDVIDQDPLTPAGK